jgi:hypothetical protein
VNEGCIIMKYRLLAVLLLLPGFVLPSGCSRNGRENTGVITGKVIFEGAPLPGGAIHFFEGKKHLGGYMIRGDGSFVAELPVGTVLIAVETDSAKHKGDREEMMKQWRKMAGSEYVHMKQEKLAGASATAPKQVYKKIPERFSRPDQSGLSYEVLPGVQEQDFELK